MKITFAYNKFLSTTIHFFSVLLWLLLLQNGWLVSSCCCNIEYVDMFVLAAGMNKNVGCAKGLYGNIIYKAI